MCIRCEILEREIRERCSPKTPSSPNKPWAVRISHLGFKVSRSGFWWFGVLRFEVLGCGLSFEGYRFWVRGSGFRVRGSAFLWFGVVEVTGFAVHGFRFGVSSLVLRVSGSGF